MTFSNLKAAGFILSVGTIEFILAMNVAEFLYPGYSTSQNYISDLGATCRTTCTIVQPTSTIFNTSVFLLGLAIISGSYLLYREFGKKAFSGLLILSGIGALGVGVFPETFPLEHQLFSLIVFLFGGLSAIFAYTFETRSFSFLSIVLGLITLTALALYISGIYLSIGPGGMERMVAYPALLWGVGLGGYLLSRTENVPIGSNSAPQRAQ